MYKVLFTRYSGRLSPGVIGSLLCHKTPVQVHNHFLNPQLILLWLISLHLKYTNQFVHTFTIHPSIHSNTIIIYVLQ